VGAFGLYLLAIFPLNARMGPPATAFVTLPVLVAGWLLGARIGLLAAVFSLLLNTLFLNLAGYPGWDVIFRRGGGPGSMTLLLVGAIVGQLSDLGEQLHRQIAERQRAEESLREAERRYRDLFEDAPVMYAITRSGTARATRAG
jgi:PAS domain-containing protein